MAVIGRVRHRCYVWSWRFRYWFLDTEDGQQARVAAFAVCVLTAMLAAMRMVVSAMQPPPPDAPVLAYGWVVWLIVLILVIALAYALSAKSPNAKPQEVESPTTEDGTPVKDGQGTFWIDHEDGFTLGFKVIGRDPIRSKGGK